MFGPLTLGLLFLLFSTIGLYEIYDLLQHNKTSAPRWFAGMSIGVLIYLLLFLIATDSLDPKWLWVLALLIPLFFFMELIRLDRSALTNLAVTIFGWVYVIIPFALINYLPMVNGRFEFEIPLGFFLILWANDTGAYFIGKFLGKRKLYESVSPNKTWEGLAGGILLSFIVSYILSTYFLMLSLNDWAVMAIIIALFGNLGDLFESHLKRIFGVKDSGNLIPGHGGVLDRFDGLFLTLPVLIFYFKIIYTL